MVALCQRKALSFVLQGPYPTGHCRCTGTIVAIDLKDAVKVIYQALYLHTLNTFVVLNAIEFQQTVVSFIFAMLFYLIIDKQNIQFLSLHCLILPYLTNCYLGFTMILLRLISSVKEL